MKAALRVALLALAREAPTDRIARDPLRFPRRYTDPLDVEIAAMLAASLAFGRETSFGAVLEALFRQADAAGGPSRWARSLGDARRRRHLEGWRYRWVTGADLASWLAALGALQERWGSLGALVEPAERSVSGLSSLMRAVRRQMEGRGGLTRGAAYLAVDPAGGSAAKRVHLAARWLVRRDGGDLGLWTHLRPASLVIPLDTHVHRIARMIGLTERASADLRTALAITDALRELDPDDPVRFDLALAHLGISGGCRGRWDTVVCPRCPLVQHCERNSAY